MNNADEITVEVFDVNPPPSSNDVFDPLNNRFSFAGFVTLMEDASGSEFPPPPDYSPPSTISTLPRSPRSPRFPHPQSSRASTSQSVIPIRCKSGNALVGLGDCTDLDQIRTWKPRYIEIRDYVMYISPAKGKEGNHVTISLKKKYISMPRKKIVAVHGGPRNLLIKASTEIFAHHWFMSLSQYCYVAPMMDGLCQKLCRGTNIFKERFLRLSSDGVLSWYSSDSEDVEPGGSIQMRGEESWIDSTNPKIIHIQIAPRGYQFRFFTKREAELWLAALHWHFGRKLLRRASVPLRNKAK